MSKSNLLLKIPSITIGIAGTALTAYNIVSDGNITARRNTKKDLGNDYVALYAKSLSSSRESKLMERIKKFAVGHMIDNSFYPIFVKAKNHVKAWGKETIENIVPLGLSILAIAAPTLIEKYKKGEIKSMIYKAFEKTEKFYKKLGSFVTSGKLIRKAAKFAKKVCNKLKTQSAGTLIAASAAGIILLGVGKYLFHDIIGISKEKQY